MKVVALSLSFPTNISNAEILTNYSGLLQSESASGQNMKVVAISLSYPTNICTPQFDSRSSSYGLIRADC
ncbi:hypothetical protein P8452_52325 [Trifolium repens]|nr:hypothetical protein P8452_52325 [Trifolium repens]